MLQKKKICKSCGQETYLFSKNMCRYCWGKANVQNKLSKKANNERSPSKVYNIPPKGKKRLNADIEYAKIKKEIEEEAKKTKKFKCYFCDKDVKGKVDYHHIEGRDGDLFTGKSNIVRTHPECHFNYHHQQVRKIWWFNDFVERLKLNNSKMFYKENNKLSK